MSTVDDLGRALRDDAAVNAPRASIIDVDAVAHAARARRRPRQWAVGTLSVVAALGLGGLAVQAVTPPTMFAASESTDAADQESAGVEELLIESGAPAGAPARVDGLLGCGVVPPAPAQGPIGLDIEVLLPSTGVAGSDLTGTVRIINVAAEPRPLLTGVEAAAVVVQGGIVVGELSIVGDTAIESTIDPGGVIELPVRVSTRACTDAAPLAPGIYSVQTLVETRRTVDEPVSALIAPESQVRLD